VRELIDERQWPAVLAESRCALTADPSDETARLGAALAPLFIPPRGNRERVAHAALEPLRQLADTAQAGDIRALAAYELGVRAQLAGDRARAGHYLRRAFLAGGPGELTLKSACRLETIDRFGPATDPTLTQQIRTCAGQGGPDIRRTCTEEDNARRPGTSMLAWPARGIVALYKAAVAPAIGSRCSLSPGCSTYFLEAGRKHGLLAFPMIADRLVREPSVVIQGAHPIHDGRRLRYADPVAAHDYWW
jgi:putative component of membrane protein insertase Oxa1/YidC/SpoIIIJ protein YidD